MTKKKPNYGAKAAQTEARKKSQDQMADGVRTASVPEDEAGKEKPKSARPVSATNENTTQISFRIPMSYRRALKLYAFEHDTTINDVFRSMLKEWLDEKGLLDG